MMDFVTSLLSGSFFLHSRDLSGYLTFIRSGELETGGGSAIQSSSLVSVRRLAVK